MRRQLLVRHVDRLVVHLRGRTAPRSTRTASRSAAQHRATQRGAHTRRGWKRASRGQRLSVRARHASALPASRGGAQSVERATTVPRHAPPANARAAFGREARARGARAATHVSDGRLGGPVRLAALEHLEDGAARDREREVPARADRLARRRLHPLDMTKPRRCARAPRARAEGRTRASGEQPPGAERCTSARQRAETTKKPHIPPPRTSPDGESQSRAPRSSARKRAHTRARQTHREHGGADGVRVGQDDDARGRDWGQTCHHKRRRARGRRTERRETLRSVTGGRREGKHANDRHGESQMSVTGGARCISPVTYTQ